MGTRIPRMRRKRESTPIGAGPRALISALHGARACYLRAHVGAPAVAHIAAARYRRTQVGCHFTQADIARAADLHIRFLHLQVAGFDIAGAAHLGPQFGGAATDGDGTAAAHHTTQEFRLHLGRADIAGTRHLQAQFRRFERRTKGTFSAAGNIQTAQSRANQLNFNIFGIGHIVLKVQVQAVAVNRCFEQRQKVALRKDPDLRLIAHLIRDGGRQTDFKGFKGWQTAGFRHPRAAALYAVGAVEHTGMEGEKPREQEKKKRTHDKNGLCYLCKVKHFSEMMYFFLLLSFFSASQAPQPAVAPGAVIEWLTPTSHNFGDIRQGKPVYFSFKYKNISAEPVVIETVRTTCGCTAAQYTEEAVMPGESGEINIEYDAYRAGAFKKKIRVFFTTQKKAEMLWIEGDVNR
jgi:hypothetical protein